MSGAAAHAVAHCATGLRHTGRRVYLHWVANVLSPASCSLNENYLYAEGALALAKVLPECKALVSLR